MNKLIASEAKTLKEAEILAERRKRVLLVIKARWIIMGSYLFYGLLAAFWYTSKISDQQVMSHFILYGTGLIGLVLYNGFLQYSYERLSKFRSIAQIQMIADVFITTLIVYYTGGAASWFWSTYLLIILQSAFLFDKKIETIEIALLSGLSFGMLTVLQYSKILDNPNLALLLQKYSSDATYSGLMVFWVVASSLAVAFIASYLMGVIRQSERYLAYKSITDGLTNLYNHSYFHKRLVSEMDRAKRYNRAISLVLIDIDDFKQYNDSFGHQEGDRILRETAKIFKDNIRACDVDSAYRYGGEEFAVIAPETESQEIGVKESGAIAMAERIRSVIEEKLPITISVGVASFPHHGEDAHSLFKAADVALYRAKEKGKNRVVITSPAMLKQELN